MSGADGGAEVTAKGCSAERWGKNRGRATKRRRDSKHRNWRADYPISQVRTNDLAAEKIAEPSHICRPRRADLAAGERPVTSLLDRNIPAKTRFQAVLVRCLG